MVPPLRIVNRRRGGWLRWPLRLLLWAGVTAGLSAGPAAVGLYVYFSQDLPDIPSVASWQPAMASHAYAQDGRLLARYATERREVVPLARMPSTLIQAFLAAEDKRFFEHGGVDYRATARAMLANLVASSTVQGASTLTQQLCKPLVGRQKSYVRKAREAILARRTEARLDKLDILYLYLNQIYLGAGAYGAQAAARTYFGVDVADLSLAQASMLAGLPPQPGRVNPFLDLPASRARQAYVLGRMVEEGFISQAEADSARQADLRLQPASDDVFGDGAPDYAEHGRRAVQARYGEDAVYRGGLSIHLAVDADLQRAAGDALQTGLETVGRRQGYVGPRAQLDTPAERAAFLAAATETYGGPAALVGDGPWLALVTGVTAKGATAQVGGLRVEIPLEGGLAWAKPYTLKARSNRGALKDPRAALAEGDVVWVDALPPAPPPKRRRKAKAPPAPSGPQARLAQPPPLEGALVAIDPRSGRVEAMVGGYDHDRSEYNRAFQGCRQPGSVFKPVVYSLALTKGYTLATPLADTPITVYDQGASFLWKPKNFGGKYRGEVLLHEALARSMNLPAIRTLQYVGADQAVRWAERLGISTPMAAQPSLVLGSSCVYPWDMVQVFGTFAARGRAARPHFVTRVLDRAGRVLEDRTRPDDAWAPVELRLDGLLRAAWEPRPQVVPEDTSYLMQTALKAVVDRGTATAAQALGRPAAGKTGTTDAYDAWFVGFTDQLVAGVWVGSDRNKRRLGRGETGGKVALPIWLAFMQAAHVGAPVVDFTDSPPESIEVVAIDPATGLLAAEGGKALRLPFSRGTPPTRAARPVCTCDAGDVAMVEGSF